MIKQVHCGPAMAWNWDSIVTQRFLPPAYVVRREGNSFTLFVSPHLGGVRSVSWRGGIRFSRGQVQPVGGGSGQSADRGGAQVSQPTGGDQVQPVGGSGQSADGGESGPADGGGSGPAEGGSGPAGGGGGQVSQPMGGSGPAGGGQHLAPSCGRYASCRRTFLLLVVCLWL